MVVYLCVLYYGVLYIYTVLKLGKIQIHKRHRGSIFHRHYMVHYYGTATPYSIATTYGSGIAVPGAAVLVEYGAGLHSIAVAWHIRHIRHIRHINRSTCDTYGTYGTVTSYSIHCHSHYTIIVYTLYLLLPNGSIFTTRQYGNHYKLPHVQLYAYVL